VDYCTVRDYERLWKQNYAKFHHSFHELSQCARSYPRCIVNIRSLLEYVLECPQ
jgi:hypothetical protein